MSIYWFEQTQAIVPEHDEWLAESELVVLGRMRIPKRRADWRLGRWTAKSAIASVLELPARSQSFKDIKILADDSGAPKAYVGRNPASISISLSHRDGVAACSLTQSVGPLGCDLELIEARDEAFVQDYFTAEEQLIIAQRGDRQRDQLVTTLWSAKESALKALRVGLRADTRSIEISLGDNPSACGRKNGENESDSFSPWSRTWQPLRARDRDGQALYGWWLGSANLIRTLVTASVTKPPAILAISS